MAAWLVRSDAAAGAAAQRVCRLGCEGCLELARAVCAASADPHEPAASVLGRCAGSLVPGLASWLEEPTDVGMVGDAGQCLTFLAAALVLPGEERSAGLPGHGDATAEAALLRETLRLAVAHAALRRGFERAVGDARLEAMRELAYGAGHEINNPLANIATRAQALLLEEVDPERRRRLSTIVDQSFRARDMIGGLMVFARPPKPRREAVDVGGIAAAAIEAVRGQAGTRGVRLEYSPLPAPVTVFVDRVQIEEAVRAVLVNALEAAAAGGRVVVRVSQASDAGDAYCNVIVEDNGRGMPLEQIKRAFDPFFSGREAGRGAGMGLPKAWRLIESSGGDVVIDSRVGHGTRVLIRLPVQAAVGQQAAAGG